MFLERALAHVDYSTAHYLNTSEPVGLQAAQVSVLTLEGRDETEAMHMASPSLTSSFPSGACSLQFVSTRLLHSYTYIHIQKSDVTSCFIPPGFNNEQTNVEI